MRKFLFAAIVLSVAGLCVQFNRVARADDKAIVSGVLIDNHCAAKFTDKDDPEKAAEDHPKACAVKCADSGYGVISGKKFIKFDDNGNKLAKEYLDKNDSTKVKVEGTEKGDELEVTAITPAEAK